MGFETQDVERKVLAFGADFNLRRRTGSIPVNVSFFPKEQFGKALQARWGWLPFAARKLAWKLKSMP